MWEDAFANAGKQDESPVDLSILHRHEWTFLKETTYLKSGTS